MASEDDEEVGTPASASPTSGESGIVPIGTTQAPVEPATPPPAGPDFTSMVRPPGDMAGITHQLGDIQRQKTATNAANSAEAIKRLDADRARMEEAYKASAVMPEELKKGWDAKAKTAEHSTDPVQAFGSIGSVFAMLASSFAGLPMEHALNAGASAINAVHAGDAKAYERDYQAWKDNTDLALKRHNIQHQIYNDATNLMNSNINAGRTKMELAATRFGDQKAQALLDAGMDKELFQLFADRNKTALEMQNQWDKVQLEHEKVQDLRSRPGYEDPAQRGAVVQKWTQDWAPGGRQTLKYDFAKDYIDQQKKANPDYTPEDLAKWGKEAANAQEPDDTKTGGMAANTPEKVFLSKRIEEYKAANDGKEPPADEILKYKEQYTKAKAAGGNSTPEKEATAKFVEEFKAAHNGQEPSSDERVAFKSKWSASTKALASDAKLGPEDAKFLAEQALKGDTSVFTNLGRGSQGAENVLMVRRAIREQATARGLNGADIALKNAEYMGLRAAERVAGSREAIIAVAANEAKNMMTVAEEASKKVPRGRWTPINEATQYVMKKSSSPELAAFAQANETLVNGYVRAVSPTGVPTDIVRRHAYAALNSAMGPEAYAAVLKVMQQEMDAAIASPEQVRHQLMERSKKEKNGEYTPLTSNTGGQAQPVAPPVPVGGIIKYDQSGTRISP